MAKEILSKNQIKILKAIGQEPQLKEYFCLWQEFFIKQARLLGKDIMR